LSIFFSKLWKNSTNESGGKHIQEWSSFLVSFQEFSYTEHFVNGNSDTREGIESVIVDHHLEKSVITGSILFFVHTTLN
jgi:hypothetical protein